MKLNAMEDMSLHPAYEAAIRTVNIPEQVSWLKTKVLSE
jgi:hypothetical protein